jgi:hypothetical protein
MISISSGMPDREVIAILSIETFVSTSTEGFAMGKSGAGITFKVLSIQSARPQGIFHPSM